MAAIVPSVTFTTLGMFIVGTVKYEIEHKSTSRPGTSWLVGGAGTYAALGARLAAGKTDAHKVGWIVDAGRDFPATFKDMIESWRTSCIFRIDKNRLTTRAWNGYGENEERAFRYLTPKLRLDQNALPNSHLLASAFHFVCSAARAIELVQGITDRRKEIDTSQKQPIFIWEPIPDLCIPSEKERFLEACKLVDMVSPNQRELAGFFEANEFQSQDRMAAMVLESGIGQGLQGEHGGILVVRADRKGCYAYQGKKILHMRPYHLPSDLNNENGKSVVDPTGGGNTFLGALAMSLVDNREFVIEIESGKSRIEKDTWNSKTAIWGRLQKAPSALIIANIAASFAIEQLGMPVLSSEKAGGEVWNGEDVEVRVKSYVTREKDYILKQARGWA